MLILLMCLCVALVVYTLIVTNTKEQGTDSVKRRISELSKDSNVEGIHSEVLAESERLRKKNNSKSLLKVSEALENKLAMAGVKLSAREYLYLWFGATIVPVFLLAIFGVSPITYIAIGAIGLATPPLLVERASKKRKELFNRQLGEALVVMGNCVRAGYTFQQAMESIATDMKPPISTEFAHVLRETKYGLPFDDAMEHMKARVDNKEFELLVTAVTISTQVGANLSDMLELISNTIRDRLKLREEAKVLTTQGRFSGVLVGILPIVLALAMMIMNPDYIGSFFENPIGKGMIAVGVVMEIVGFVVVNKIVDIKY
ncbi:MAG: secretion system protein [Ruminococcaceae bacterium]|nr:secretion system protein [Oscillospiraceae bacterium]